MPFKRSRPESSSSIVEKAISGGGAASSVSTVKVMKTDVAAEPEPSQPQILTFTSPVNVVESDRVKIGGFLERCHYCQKRIAQNSEVFMYSTLCAFCSAECRDFQIALDRSAKNQSKNPK